MYKSTNESEVNQPYIEEKSQVDRKKDFLWFIRTVQIASVISLGTFGLINWFIDPYSVWNSPTVAGLNQTKPHRSLEYVRLFKAVDVTRIKPKTIFLGTSRTEYGLDPTHPSVTKNLPAYNLALSDASAYEMMRYFQHALVNQPELKTVVIGIDFFMFNDFKKPQSSFTEDRLEKQSISLRDALDVSLSFSALQLSKETIGFNRKHSNSTSPYAENGWRVEQYFFEHNSLATPNRFERSLSNFLENPYKKYKLSTKELNHLKTIIDICGKRGIEVKVFISPSHATQWEAVRAAGLWQEFEQWKREVSKIAPVWDFSGYNSITSEPVRNEMNNYLDSSHYRKKVGDLVLNRLFSAQEKAVPADFGTLITPANVEAHLIKVRQQREAWAKSNPKLVKLVQDLAKKAK